MDKYDVEYRMERFEKDRGITGCCSVTARGSVQLARALVDTGLAGRIPAIGSDVFVKHPFFIWNRTCMTKKHNSVLKKFLFAKHK